jgi:hypothetical protein
MRLEVFVKMALMSVFLVGQMAWAATAADIKGALVPVRETLLEMLSKADKRGPEQVAEVKKTAQRVTEMINGLKVDAAKKGAYDELKTVWTEFSKVRDEQVVPMIQAGKIDEAKALANGEQKARLKKVMELCEQLK